MSCLISFCCGEAQQQQLLPIYAEEIASAEFWRGLILDEWQRHGEKRVDLHHCDECRREIDNFYASIERAMLRNVKLNWCDLIYAEFPSAGGRIHKILHKTPQIDFISIITGVNESKLNFPSLPENFTCSHTYHAMWNK